MITETTTEVGDGHLRLSRQFEAPREIIFKAWTDPSWLVRWMGPQECTCPHAETDLRVGGAFKMAIRGPEGNDHWAHGIYKEVNAPDRLVFSWQWEQEDGSLGAEMLIALDFRDNKGGTELTLTQTRFPTDESRDQHRGGWSGAFQSLAAELENLVQDS
jgi:uncharacterized protein YndB with AHSA1/START domain